MARANSRCGLFVNIENAYIDGLNISGRAETETDCGGIVAYAKNSTINNCVSNINNIGYYSGFAGIACTINYSTVSNCIYKGTIDVLNEGSSIYFRRDSKFWDFLQHI